MSCGRRSTHLHLRCEAILVLGACGFKFRGGSLGPLPKMAFAQDYHFRAKNSGLPFAGWEHLFFEAKARREGTSLNVADAALD